MNGITTCMSSLNVAVNLFGSGRVGIGLSNPTGNFEKANNGIKLK